MKHWRHGSRANYTVGACRCDKCREATKRAQTWYRRVDRLERVGTRVRSEEELLDAVQKPGLFWWWHYDGEGSRGRREELEL